MRLAYVLLQSLLVGLPALGAYAQSTLEAGSVVGVLKDRTGAVVPAGVIQIKGLDAGFARSTVSDAAGRYAFDAVPPGRYSISAVAPGLERAVIKDFVVAANTASSKDFALDVARRQVFVEVTAAAGNRPLEVVTDPRTPRQPIPAHDGADYLKTIPGFSVIRKGGADGDPVLRGMAGSRIGMLLDGEGVLGGCGNRMDPPTAYAFPEAYDRITVLKGPQSVLHGPGNSAGVVLFERQRERYTDKTIHAYASPTFGSFGRNDQVAEIKAGNRVAYARASATRSALDGYEDGNGAAVHSRYERWSADAALGWTPVEATRIEFSGASSDGEAAYADRAMDGVGFARDNLGLRIEHRNLSSTFKSLEAQAFYNYVDHVMDNFSLRRFTPSMMMPNKSVSNPDRRTLGARVEAALAFGDRTTASVGGDFQTNRHSVRSSSNQMKVPFETLGRVQDAEFETGGVFAELTQAIGAKGRLLGGLRADRWTGTDQRQTLAIGMAPATPTANPTAGLTRRETLISGFARYEREIGSATLYAGVGHAERAPDYWELISKESVASISAFNARPEITTQLDAGLLYRAGALSGSVAMFVNGMSDFLLVQSNYAKTSSTMGGMGGGMPGGTSQRLTTITRNVETSSWGGEASLNWAATARFKFDTSLAYVRGENKTDLLPLAQLPPLEARFGVQYSHERWSMGALARVVAAQGRYSKNQGNIVGQDLGPTDGFSVFSLNGSWRISPRVQLSAGADNLLDKAYSEFISRGGATVPGYTSTTRVNEPGRMLWVKLDLRY
jgi:iron complex outermembrane receptor protein